MLLEFEGYRPAVAETAFVAPTAVLIGNVVVGERASIWFGAVLRGDHGEQGIEIGAGTSVQDNVVIHVSQQRGTRIGQNVTIGHGAILEGCDVEDGALVGMNAVVLEGASIGARSLIAAGSTVLAGTVIPPAHVAAGAPARIKKPLAGEAARWIDRSAEYYVDLAARYRAAGIGGREYGERDAG